MSKSKFGINLNKLRLEKHLTKKQLAKMSGLSAVQIRNLEEGKNEPSAITISKLANALCCNYDILYEYSQEKET